MPVKIICRQSPANFPLEKTEILSKNEEVIVCALCNHRITDPLQQIIINQSFNHIFVNPHGHIYEIGCFSHASGCHPASVPSDEFSWFIGYSWQICFCDMCSTHLGWYFTSELNRFWGLILKKLIFP
ncbi:MAG: hypothetical protein A2328_09755 [Bdellovibrionales bacterium RIFOXYB2_FULL_36_6]|nr:MAG: hypothetical protein A2328_09755 [Bdellovibrionales bacterium RIFOXYB2_FULL_36_6]